MSETKEKKTLWLRFRETWIPWKGDRPGEIIRKIILIISFIVLVVSLGIIISDNVSSKIDQKKAEEDKSLVGEVVIPDIKQEEIRKEYPEVQDWALNLLDKNKDFIGWITIPNEPMIDYPVVQGDDNEYYLTHAFDGSESKFGTVYADSKVRITAESRPNNIVLYGHNVEIGTYFAMLTRYFNQRHSPDLSYYKEHPTIEFSTIYENGTVYKIFAGMYVNIYEKDGEVFPYHTKRNFSSKSDFDDYMGKVFDRSTFYNPDVSVAYGDEILTLSTCIDVEYPNDYRWVVYARKVRDGESPEVDVEKAYANPDPLFPDTYYNIWGGGGWGGRAWDTSLIEDFEG